MDLSRKMLGYLDKVSKCGYSMNPQNLTIDIEYKKVE